MEITTYRFGSLEVPDDKIISMKRPLLGFEEMTQFCLIEQEQMHPFMVLQSVQDPALAFMVVNPAFFYPSYRLEVNPKEIAELKIDDLKAVETYAIVTVPDDPSKMSVNLQGPILINTENNFAKQLVLVNSQYRVHHLLMEIVDASAEKVVSGTEFVGV